MTYTVTVEPTGEQIEVEEWPNYLASSTATERLDPFCMWPRIMCYVQSNSA